MADNKVLPGSLTVNGNLTVTGTYPGGGSSTFVGCRAKLSANFSVANDVGAGTAIPWDAEDFDTDAIHSTVTNTTRFTIPVGRAGKWEFIANISWTSSASGRRIAWWQRSGVTWGNDEVVPNGTIRHQVISGPVQCAEGDIFEILVYQNSLVALNVLTDYSWASAQFLGT